MTNKATTMTDSVSTVGSRVLGIGALVGVAVLLYCAFVWTGADETLGESVRLLYVHVPSAVLAYVGCLLTFAGSIGWLWKRSVWWDLVASSASEVALVFTTLTLATGSIWGKATWGVWWVWDARLTSTAMLFLLLLGYIALRQTSVDREVQAGRASWLGVLLIPNIVLVHRYVERSLHQDTTFLRINPTIDGPMLFTTGLGVVVFLAVFAWLELHRFRISWLSTQVADADLREALARRREEALAATPGADDVVSSPGGS